MLGESLTTAQAQLGHSGLQTTLEVYTHPIPETQRAAVERLEHLLMDPNGPKLDPGRKPEAEEGAGIQ